MSSQILVTKRLVFSSVCVSLYMYIVNVWYSLPLDGMAKINFKEVLFDQLKNKQIYIFVHVI